MLTVPPYAFSLTSSDGYCVVRASGEIDVAAIPRLRYSVHAAQGRGEHVIVDMRDVSFLDGCALRALGQLQGDDRDPPVLHFIAGKGIQRMLDLAGARASLSWISAEQLRA